MSHCCGDLLRQGIQLLYWGMHTALLHYHEDNEDRVLNSTTKQPRQGPSGREFGRSHSVLIGFLPLILPSEASIYQVISVILDTSMTAVVVIYPKAFKSQRQTVRSSAAHSWVIQ